jgi:hypothetical protein
MRIGTHIGIDADGVTQRRNVLTERPFTILSTELQHSGIKLPLPSFTLLHCTAECVTCQHCCEEPSGSIKADEQCDLNIRIII